MSFELHKKLAADCTLLGDLELCTVLLMRDDRFPWVILVPRIEGLRDLHDLPRRRALDLFGEITAVSRALVDQFEVEKINVAALGNQVPPASHSRDRPTHVRRGVARPGVERRPHPDCQHDRGQGTRRRVARRARVVAAAMRKRSCQTEQSLFVAWTGSSRAD